METPDQDSVIWGKETHTASFVGTRWFRACHGAALRGPEAAGNVRAFLARTSRWRARPAPLSASASCLRSRTSLFCEKWRSHPPRIRKKWKRAREGPFLIFGGGGGNRTPVRKSYVPGSTCIARRLVSSCGNTTCEAHRRTSRLGVSRGSTGSDQQRSCDSDPTSTSTSTSGFGTQP